MFNNKIQRDMQFKDSMKTKLPFFVALSALFVLASCGSYQYTGYDNDGIYSSEKQPVEVTEEVKTTSSDASYFKNYFSEKSDEYEAIASENEIFTDIDSYEGYSEQEVDSIEYATGYSGWGSTNDETIIVINNGWNNWGWNDPWLWNSGFGWGWNRPFWGRGFGWGWNSWAWNGFGWGWNNWGWNAGFGWGWNNFWCPPFYGNNFYGGNNLYASTYGRRGGAFYNGYSRLGRTSTALNRSTSRRNSIASRSNLSRNSGRASYSRNRGRTVTRNTGRSRNTMSSSSRPRTRVNSSSRPRVNSSSRPRTRVNSRPRSVSPTRSSGVRSSSGRSSSMSRSSGSRSSGSRGGGRRR